MASLTPRFVFQAARPVQRLRDPATFLRSCRITPATNNRPKTGFVQRRAISATSPRRATVVLRNPRTDDDGKDMTITISERAAKRLKQITTSPPTKNSLVPTTSTPDSHLRVTVTSGGCHGFQYLMSLEQESKIDHEEDTVFAAEEGDVDGKAQVVMDLPSLELLQGSTVDFTQELIGSQFKIVGNPRASSSCGCGTSFDIE